MHNTSTEFQNQTINSDKECIERGESNLHLTLVGENMRRDEYKLFSQGEIAHLTVKNRLVRSATYEGEMTEDGKVTPQMLNLYKNLANGGVGTIITGHMVVKLEGKAGDRKTSGKLANNSLLGNFLTICVDIP